MPLFLFESHAAPCNSGCFTSALLRFLFPFLSCISSPNLSLFPRFSRSSCACFVLKERSQAALFITFLCVFLKNCSVHLPVGDLCASRHSVAIHLRVALFCLFSVFRFADSQKKRRERRCFYQQVRARIHTQSRNKTHGHFRRQVKAYTNTFAFRHPCVCFPFVLRLIVVVGAASVLHFFFLLVRALQKR